MNSPLVCRRGGVLLHPTSLPGPGYCGDFGAEARRFVDLLASAGLSVWQVLPLGPTHPDGCPYQSFSAHAGSPDLIDLNWLVARGWLSREQADAGQREHSAKRTALNLAGEVFFRSIRRDPAAVGAEAWRQFLRDSALWLEDYVLFQAIRSAQGYRPWTQWPAELRDRDPATCARLVVEQRDRLDQLRFRQFVFDCQWHELRRYANAHGILLFGDMPIYVHMESADVWANRKLFELDPSGQPLTVTGVPPDYFSADGQLWGNPQYHWGRMQAEGFRWWLQRFGSAARQFDVVRIDHFRALEAYWEIPAGAASAREGKWVQAPGRQLLQAVREQYPNLCLVAENLGTITPEVEALRAEFSLPGMLILQFAFDGNPDNPYLNHNHHRADVVYTGTHDNDTTKGWFDSLNDELRGKVYAYYAHPAESMPWMLIHQAMASVADTAIVPWQDFLELGSEHRMNTPGTTSGNWRWRFRWEQLPPGLDRRIHTLLTECDRLPPG
jgi:4-alpha-glucanotransferase